MRAWLFRRLMRGVTWRVHHLPNDGWRVEATWPSRGRLMSWWADAKAPYRSQRDAA